MAIQDSTLSSPTMVQQDDAVILARRFLSVRPSEVRVKFSLSSLVLHLLLVTIIWYLLLLLLFVVVVCCCCFSDCSLLIPHTHIPNT